MSRRNDGRQNKLLYLPKPIPNPKPDRRRTRDWTSAEEFPAGVYVVEDPYEHMLKAEYLERAELVAQSRTIRRVDTHKLESGYSSLHASADAEQYKALYSALRPLPQHLRVKALFIESDLTSSCVIDVLERLCSTGQLTRHAIEACLKAVEANWNEEAEIEDEGDALDRERQAEAVRLAQEAEKADAEAVACVSCGSTATVEDGYGDPRCTPCTLAPCDALGKERLRSRLRRGARRLKDGLGPFDPL